jgi:hypothetical protein
MKSIWALVEALAEKLLCTAVMLSIAAAEALASQNVSYNRLFI